MSGQTISEDWKTIGKNSPIHFQMKPKPSVFLKAPSCTRINCPSKYVLSTHNHTNIFSQGNPGKKRTSKKQLTEAVTSESSVRGDSLYKEHLFKTYQALRFVKGLAEPSPEEIQEKLVFLERRRGFEHMRTLVLDLDETLVHCVEDPSRADVPISITFPNGEQVRAGINIRPYAIELLRAANQHFEVIVFTASHQIYANKVLDHLDPNGLLIHHRLYRESCIYKDGVFVKDLRILADRNVEDILIVDNAVYSFAFQLGNGVPVMSWYDCKQDKELFKLIDYLKVLAQTPNLVQTNSQVFKLWEFYNEYSHREEKENIIYK